VCGSVERAPMVSAPAFLLRLVQLGPACPVDGVGASSAEPLSCCARRRSFGMPLVTGRYRTRTLFGYVAQWCGLLVRS